MTTIPPRDDLSQDVGPDSGAYVLHALSDAENERFEAALASSEEARAEVTGLADTAVELGLSIAPVDPPAELRAHILNRLDATPQLAPLEPAAEGDPVAELAPNSETHDTPAQARARRRWASRPVTTLLAAAAAAALIFGGGVAVNAVIQGQNASVTAAQVTRIEAAADAQRSTVAASTGGTATLIWSASLKRSAIVLHGLDRLPQGKTYELWYIRAGGATPAGTFDANGSPQSVVLAGDMTAGDTVGVTVEPSGGSRSPTTTPIAVIATA